MSFAYFDFEGRADVEVKVNYTAVREALVRPLAAGLRPPTEQNTLRLSLTEPKKLSVEVNGDLDRCLFIFANPIERDRPKPTDPNVMYFGPGVHDIDRLVNRKSDTTIYVAGGAVLRGRIY